MDRLRDLLAVVIISAVIFPTAALVIAFVFSFVTWDWSYWNFKDASSVALYGVRSGFVVGATLFLMKEAFNDQ